MAREDGDILKIIPDEELLALKSLLERHIPNSIHAYYFLDNHIAWRAKGEEEIVFYCPEGKWDDGTFFAIENNSDQSVFLFSLDKSGKRLKKTLETTSKIKWNVRTNFVTVHEDHQPILLEELNRRRIKFLSQHFGILFWIPKEEALNYEYSIPEDVQLCPLQQKDVDLIDSLWPLRGVHSKNFISRLIRLNGGFGLYSTKDGSLCSWIMKNNIGALAILQTVEKHKKKGYGEILTKHISKFWAEKGLDVFCIIMTHNKNSMNLFHKLGYRKEHSIMWIEFNKDQYLCKM